MLGRVVVRRLSSLAEPLPRATRGKYPVPNSQGYKKLMEKQSIMCRDDGRLVWQKMPADMFLYRGSCIAVAVGFLMTSFALFRLASPPKNG